MGDFEQLDPSLQQFLREVVEHGQVWALRDEGGWALTESEEAAGVMVLPVWSAAEAAAAAATGPWGIYAATAITLDEFLELWLPGLEGDGDLVGVNWDEALEGIEIPPLELQADLEAVIEAADEQGIWDDPPPGGNH